MLEAKTEKKKSNIGLLVESKIKPQMKIIFTLKHFHRILRLKFKFLIEQKFFSKI